MIIRKLTEQDKIDFKAKHPMGNPLNWEVVDEDGFSSHFNTEAEAKEAFIDEQVDEAVSEHLEQFISDMIEAFDTDRESVIRVLRSAS